MLIREEDNKSYSKNKDDQITKYLKNILQRYFEIEKNTSQETKEAIIIQAFTRLKEAINALQKEYVLCINEKSGAICLDITDLNGEWAFDKNTAYNKDFCENGEEQEDTIVMGNDIRLNDQRIPLAHVHTAADIRELNDILRECNFDNTIHLHERKDVLDLIKYTGSRASIDLVLLKYLSDGAEEMINHFSEQDNYVYNIAKRFKLQFKDLLTPLEDRLEYIKNSADAWVEEAKNNVEAQQKSFDFMNETRSIFHKFLSKEEYNKLMTTLGSAPVIIKEGYIDKEPDTIKILKINNKIPLQDYISMRDTQEFDTDILLLAKTIEQFTNQDLNEILDHNLLHSNIKLYLEYEEDGLKNYIKLPGIYRVNNEQTVLMNYEINSKNELIIKETKLCNIPYYIQKGINFTAIVSSESLYPGKEYDEKNYYKENIVIDANDTEKIVIGEYVDYNYVKKENRKDPEYFDISNVYGSDLKVKIKLIKDLGEGIEENYREYPNKVECNFLFNTTKPAPNKDFYARSFINYYADGELIKENIYIGEVKLGEWRYNNQISDPSLNGFGFAETIDFDIMPPSNICITGECTLNTEEKEHYSINIKYGDCWEEIGIVVQLLDADVYEALNEDNKTDITKGTELYRSNEVKLFTGIKENDIECKIGSLAEQHMKPISQEDGKPGVFFDKNIKSDHEIQYEIEVIRPYDNYLYFECFNINNKKDPNTGENYNIQDYNDFEEYLKNEGINIALYPRHGLHLHSIHHPLEIDGSDQRIIKTIDSDWFFNPNAVINEEDAELGIMEETGTTRITTTDEIEEYNFLGEITANGLKHLLNNCKYYYQIYKVPGKGES